MHAKNRFKKVAIVIVVFNGKKYFTELFESLSKVNYPKEYWKIIVVDNASTDESVSCLRKWSKPSLDQIKIIENDKNMGFAEGNNIGIRYALSRNFDYVYLLNQDTVASPDFLLKAIEAGEADDNVGSVQSKLVHANSALSRRSSGRPSESVHANSALRMRPSESAQANGLLPRRPSESAYWLNKNKINSAGNAIHFLGFGYCQSREPDSLQIAYASGAGALLKTKILRRLGLFDPVLFLYHEDLDLGWRLLLAGYQNVLAPDSVVYHKYEFSRSIQKYYWMERNRFIVMFKNYKLPTLFLIFPALLGIELGLFLFSFKNGWWREKLRVYKYFLNLVHWQKIWQERKKIQKSRRVSDRKIIRVFVSKIESQELTNPVIKYIANPVFGAYWAIVKRLIFW